jgi:hypothetical protein
MTHARIAMLAVLVFALSAGTAAFLLGYLKAKSPVAQQPVAQETIAESTCLKQEQGPLPLEAIQSAPSRIQIAEDNAGSLRRAFLACFGYSPPRDPLLLTTTERADLWLSIFTASGTTAGPAQDRCRTAQ